MILTNAVFFLVAAAGASAQRWRRPPPAGPTPEPTPAPPPPALGETQSMWGQCGGRDWEYATDCPPDATCYNDGENEWYSQCIPRAEAEELAQNPDIETRILTTLFDAPGPTPSVVTTYITIYTPAPQPQPAPAPPITITAVPDTPINGRKRRRST
ncbi:hypothetical protein VUR80DRAFT_8762 [Thermomyces stellatus]